jgi:hypothetical protein
MSLTTDLDRVITSEPNDKTAALVTGTGIHWEPERPANWTGKSYDAPPPTIRWTQPGDLTGTRYGRIRVVGLLKAKFNWSLWLVRCQCGAWEDRTAGAIAGRAAGACWRCDRLLRMQAGRTLEVAAPRRKPKPANVIETALATKAARAMKREPTTTVGAALVAALRKRLA